MKKKLNKKVPSYAFGVNGSDPYMNYMNYGGSLIDTAGSIVSGVSDEKSKGSVAGSTLKGLGTGAAMGASIGSVIPGIGTAIGGAVGAVAGTIGGLVTGRKRRREAIERANREATIEKTRNSLNQSAIAESEYWDDMTPAYTFENGGVLPDLAYVDNNEIIRDDYGNIFEVPNNKPGTDNHLIDASDLESVLSDKIKKPGTNKTFAKEGKRIAKMTKPSKGNDIFAENTNKLNKINANKAYEQLLAEQEDVKAKKGIKPKVKGIPAYEDGKGRRYPRPDVAAGYMDYEGRLWSPYGKYEGKSDLSISPSARDSVILQESHENMAKNMPTRTNSNVKITGPATRIYDPVYSREGLNSTNFGILQWDPKWSAALNEASKQDATWFDNLTEPLLTRFSNAIQNLEVMPGPAPGRTYRYRDPITRVDGITGETILTTRETPSATKTTTKTTTKETATPATITPAEVKAEYPDITLNPVNISLEPITRTDIPQLTVEDPIIDLSPINRRMPASSKRTNTRTSAGYMPNLLSLTPVLYNFAQSLRNPEVDPLVTNPYAGAIASNMARRRRSIEPIRNANRRTRAISNYNLANMSANTGVNLAARTQAAANEYAANADLYAQKQNADNSYLAEYSQMLNNLGQQFVSANNLYNDNNARNRARSRDFGSAAASQIGKWSQVNRQERNMYNRDRVLLPYLADYLKRGYTEDMVNRTLKI